MSEFHPNRQKLVRTKPGLTARRILEMWPLLVWLAVIGMALWAYRKGVQFNRMNGAVDVYQENITPMEDNRLAALSDENGNPIKVGQRVKPGQVVALMEDKGYRERIAALLHGAYARRTDDVSDLQDKVLDDDKELRGLRVEMAKEEAELQAFQSQMTAEDGKAQKSFLYREAALEVKKLAPVVPALKASIEQVEKSKMDRQTRLNNMIKGQEALLKAADLADKAKSGFEIFKLEADFVQSLDDGEQQDYFAEKRGLELCRLTTTAGGTVSVIEKEAGEYCQAGESVLRIVGDPEKLVCFLPQDQTGDLKLGQQVWVSPAYKKEVAYMTKVVGISPRIDNLPDSTSPLPNKRIHGQYVELQYPPDCLPRAPGDSFLLLPGETIIVHLRAPGEIPLINRIFHSDEKE